MLHRHFSMHLSCWVPAISVNYSASALQLVHLFLIVDELPYGTPESAYTGEHPYMSRSLQGYNFNTFIQQKRGDLRKANHVSFDGLTLYQQRATKMKIVFKIIDQRVRLKFVVVGNLSWNGLAFLREKKPVVVINEDSASGRTRPFLFSDITRLVSRKNENLVHLNASCLVPSKHLTHPDIVIVHMTKKSEVTHKSPITVPAFVSVEDQSSSLFTPRDVTYIDHVNETELHNEYQGSGRAAARKLQLVVLYGRWQPWTQWSKCSSVCGKSGLSVRERKCRSLPRIPCEGMGFDMRECIPGVKCQAKFSDWANWGPCSTSCGEGVRARSRVCVTEEQGLKCNGMSSLLERCSMPKCGQKQHVVVYPALPPGSFPEFMKGKNLVAQKYYMFPAKLVQRGDLDPNASPAPRFPSAYQDIEDTPSEVELYLNIRIPEPPLRAPPRHQRIRTSPVDPYIWSDWGQWSVCSKRCGDGYRLRKRMCIDHSQVSDVRARAMWCGKGDVSQMVHCVGSCSPVQAVEEGQFLSSKLRVVETEGGPHVKAHDRLTEKMNIEKAEIVETGSRYGPNVELSSDNDKSGPVSKLVVEETGGKEGPIVRSEHELESSTTEPEAILQIGDLQLSGETILYIVLFLLCVVLLVVAFCVYFLQRIIEANTRKQMLAANPLYKPDDGREEDADEQQPLEGLVKPVVLQKKEPTGLTFREQKLLAESRSRKKKLLETPRRNSKVIKNLKAQYNKDSSGGTQIRKPAT